jgi:hypothetical protein
MAIPLARGAKGDGTVAEIAGTDRAKSEKAAVLVESKLRFGAEVAVMEIAGERVMALARPLDRSPDPSGHPGNECKFRTGAVADAEIAAVPSS